MKLLKYALPLLMLVLFIAYGQAQTPSSSRSKKAVNNQILKLKKEFNQKGYKWGSQIFMRIFKEQNELELWVENKGKFELFKTYEICYYSGELGPKTQLGDQQSPEGFYYVKPWQLNPWSNFHLSFNIGYPNKYDKAYDRTGNYIMVHGSCVSIGCFAMTDPVIEEIWTIINSAYDGGQPYFRIHIFPFPLNHTNMAKHKSSPHYQFWLNLKTGYDLFETNKRPPNVEVENKKYVFD